MARPRALAVLAALLAAPSLPSAVAFAPRPHPGQRRRVLHQGGASRDAAPPITIARPRPRHGPSSLPMAPRAYGPVDPPPSTGTGTSDRDEVKSQFAQLLRQIVEAPAEEHPGLLAQHVELVFRVMGDQEGGRLLEEIMREDVEQYEGDREERLTRVSEAVNLLLSFVEQFAEETKSMDDVYKKLLGTIFQSIVPGGNASAGDDGKASSAASVASLSASDMENQLDDLLAASADAFTPGFLRHVEGECDRLSSLPRLSPESARMLEILRVIQARVLEELGQGIGEGAVVLGQLLGYDDERERLAVLEAGLAVRGTEFAQELAALTEEALGGFKCVPGGADPGLVKAVEKIDERIRRFIGTSAGDFQ
ncbi:hypothetical protein ACHAXT_003422 [Thalassiosira profunda]